MYVQWILALEMTDVMTVQVYSLECDILPCHLHCVSLNPSCFADPFLRAILDFHVNAGQSWKTMTSIIISVSSLLHIFIRPAVLLFGSQGHTHFLSFTFQFILLSPVKILFEVHSGAMLTTPLGVQLLMSRIKDRNL